MKPFVGSLQKRSMHVNKSTTFTHRINTVSMTEKKELTEREKALIAIAHEIRNPLTAIKITSQLIQEALEKDDQDRSLMQSYALIISHNTARIEDHLKGVLNYKPASAIDFKAVNICDCLSSAITEVNDRLYLNNIDLHKNYEGSHWILGNPEKLTTAFINIIINAVEAIQSERGKIWINLHEVNSSIRITFKDNGIGMESDTANHMFDPYFSHKKDGVGIGLSHVKEIMRLHHAKIVIDSLPDIGTSVSILFSSIPANEVRHTSKGSSRTSSL